MRAGSARLRDARDRAALERSAHAERNIVAGRPVPSRRRSPPVSIVGVAHGCARRRAPNSRPISSETALKSRSGSSSVATATATRLRAACSSASVASSSRACAFASATATRPANCPSRSSAFAGNCRSRGERHDDGAPDVARHDDRRRDQGRHAERDQPLVELRRERRGRPWPGGPARPSARPGRARCRLDHDDRAGARDLDARLAPLADDDPFVPAGLKRTRFAASAPSRRATSSVTTSKTRSAAVSVATVTATRFRAACSATSMRRSISRPRHAEVARLRTDPS